MSCPEVIFFFGEDTDLGPGCAWQSDDRMRGRGAGCGRQAVDDAESEWSQHHAKRYIDTRAKGLQGSIPPNFAYFHVEFGLACALPRPRARLPLPAAHGHEIVEIVSAWSRGGEERLGRGWRKDRRCRSASPAAMAAARAPADVSAPTPQVVRPAPAAPPQRASCT